MMKKISTSLILLFAFGGIFVNSTDPKDVKKWAKQIKDHHFLTSCWGAQTMLEYYKASENFIEECMQLTPVFDIDLFEDGPNDINTDPFTFQTSPSQIFNAPPIRVSNNNPNPWDAWMAFWAPYYGQNPHVLPTSYYKFPTRSKRAIDPPSQEDLEQFAQQVDSYKNMKKSAIGNLTCVLSKFGSLDANLNIQLSTYTQGMWNEFAKGEEPDEEFKRKMIEGYQLCYQASQSIPMEVLSQKGPFYKQFGRQMMFFKCEKMLAESMCVKKELAKWVEFVYGTPDPALRAKLGLPNDLYDAAFMAMTIKDEMKNPISKKIDEFLFMTGE